ncbi:MAG: malto-oligosyltrehalose trehalohydrolase [Chloroflexota bacterium]
MRFSVWAPEARAVDVVIEHPSVTLPLEKDANGVWSADVPHARPGSRYRFRVDGQGPFPDPYSRSQPDGVHGASEVIDPTAFVWHDADWPGLTIQGLVVYQLHVGTATPDGTFDALIADLPRLAALGCNAVEPLPVCDFPGQRNWGYDGVDLFAPTRAYGGPDALKRFIDAAHQHGIGVILDVVYNHFGPDGNYLRGFATDYFTDRYKTPWGDAINYDGVRCEQVRQLVLDNVRYWIDEFHADGLRLDATHAIYDNSPRHLLADVTDAARNTAAAGRGVVLIAETHENDVRYLLPTNEGGFGFDAVWADDFHHTMRRFLAGDHEGYYRDFAGTLDEVAHCIQHGWLYDGQPTPSSDRRERRGTPAGDRPAWQFIYVLQNHDQVGNRPFGDRLTADVDVDRYRAAAAVLLFLPSTPMLFMGQEYGARTPFQYFTDHNPELGRLVTEGRRKEFAAFSAFADPATREKIPDPQARSTFERSKLDRREADSPDGARTLHVYTALLHARRDDAVLATQDRRKMTARGLTSTVLAVHRWLEAGYGARRERLLLVNFGDDEVRVDDYGADWTSMIDTAVPARSDGGGLVLGRRSASILRRESA